MSIYNHTDIIKINCTKVGILTTVLEHLMDEQNRRYVYNRI
jgi:hypothetical protein